MKARLTRSGWGLLLWLAAGSAACADDTAEPDDGAADVRPDGDVEPDDAGESDVALDGDGETGPEADGSLPGFCDDETRCDDGLECTVDSCEEEYDRCTHTPDDTVCQDGVACNDEEQCRPGEGCRAGLLPDCRDESPCTIDTCVEARGGCVHDPRDLDGDTYVTRDYDCGGDDCNDGDREVHPDLEEVCDDRRDNNCDDRIDFDDPSCRPANDSCAGAVLLAEGVTTNSSTRGTVADYGLPCSWDRAADVVFRIELAATRDVIVGVRSLGGGAPYVDFQTRCGDSSSSLRCVYGSDVTLRRNSLAPGSYWVVVQGNALDFSIVYTTADPTPVPANDVCSGATDLPAAGGTVHGSLLDTSNHYAPTCSSGSGHPDVFYRLVLTEPKKVTLELDLPLTDWDSYSDLALTSTCGDPATELACASGDYWSGTRPTIVRNFLDTGTYSVVVDSNVESDFTLNVRLEAPILPPANDRCAGSIDVTGGGWFLGSVVDTYRDYPPSCSRDPFADVVYGFTLAEPQDVTLRVTPLGADARYVVALRTDCADGASEVGCRAGNPAELIRRSLPAGTYSAIVSGDALGAGARFLLEVAFGPATPVPPGDTCLDAADISAGGRFTGTTLACSDDYEATCAPGMGDVDAVYSFRLAAPRDVTLAFGGSSAADAYLDLRMGACGTGGTSVRCAGGRAPTLFSRNLPAGDYWVLAETSSETAHTLDATFAAPTSACGGAETITIDYAAGATFTAVVSGDTRGRSDDFTSECYTWSTAPDVPYLLVVPVRSAVAISSDHSSAYFDGTLYIRSTCDLPSSELACNDDCPYVGLSCLPGSGGTMTLEAGTYTIIQDGLGADGGAYTLTVTATRL